MVEETFAPVVHMEEEETIDRPSVRRHVGFGRHEPRESSDSDMALSETLVDEREVIRAIMDERRQILADDRLNVKAKLRLLENNRLTLVAARGGTIRKTENIVYGILVFSAVMLVILALLTTYAKLRWKLCSASLELSSVVRLPRSRRNSARSRATLRQVVLVAD
jgi:uncharacterized membrane protein affecting hemolysin expression